jgi:hypothetical protein
MAISEVYSGSQAATLNTTYTLNTTSPETADGIYQLFVDTSNMVSGDILEITILEKCTASSTIALCVRDTLIGAQAEPLWSSPALCLINGFDMKIKQTFGTGRTFTYSVRKVA